MKTFFRCLLSFLVLCHALADLQAATVTAFSFPKTTYELYEKVEGDITLGSGYANPYDPDIIAVDAEITPPSGPMYTIPCFYMVPVTWQTSWANLNSGSAGWKLRFTPTQVGTYSIRIIADDGSVGTSATLNITAVDGGRKGFIDLDATEQQFLRHETGEPYYPLGINLGWHEGNMVTWFNDYFSSYLSPNRINWIRYWQTEFSGQDLEWSNSASYYTGWYPGLGEYSQRGAAFTDSVLNLCEANDTYMQLVLFQHGSHSTTTNAKWNPIGGGSDGNPYRQSNGGPVPDANPEQFFSLAAAKTQVQKRLRYTVARWGYSPHILTWELFNEVNYADRAGGSADGDVDTWHDEMGQYLHSLDPYNHIVTTSTSGYKPLLLLMDDNTGIDQLQFHRYSGSIDKGLELEAEDLLSSLTKPILCGEFGASDGQATNYVGYPDQWGDHIRRAVWKGAMTGVPNMFWFWQGLMREQGLYWIYDHAQEFLDGVDIVTETGGQAINGRYLTQPSGIGSVSIAPATTTFLGTNSPNPWTTTIDGSGSYSNAIGLNQFIAGIGNGGISRDLQITANFATTGSLTLNVTGVSGWNPPQQIQVYLDGGLQTTWSISGAGAQTLSGIPAGSHTIRLYGVGQDWVQFSSIDVNNVQLNYLQTYGYHGGDYAYAYITDDEYGFYADPSSVSDVTGATYRLGPMPQASYQVEFFSPVSGAWLGTQTVGRINDSITLTFPTFKKDIAFRVSPDPALPVAWATFSGHWLDEQTAELKWTAEGESGGLFTLERSDDGSRFLPVTTVPSASNGMNSYRATDAVGENRGTVYYRIRYQQLGEVDSYSQVVTLSREASDQLLVRAYPNPSDGPLNLRINGALYGQVSVQVSDAMGRSVIEEQFTLKNEVVKLAGFAELPRGLYLLRVTDASGRAWTGRVVKP